MADKTSHEMYQEYCLDRYKGATKLPKETTLVQVIEALADMGQPNEATEMLFGRERGRLADDQIGFVIFMYLWAGKNPGLIKEVARNHYWVTGRPCPSNGFGIQVYPKEFLAIKEPTAAKVLRAIT